MRKFLMTMAAVAACAASSSAWAQGRPDIWAGAYAGLQIGGASNQFWYKSELTGNYDSSGYFNGAEVGGHIGFNWQSGGFVYGIEVDAASQFGKRASRYTDPWGGFGEFTNSAPIMGSARARLGYASGQLMAYGTAGITSGKLQFSYKYSDPWSGTTGSGSETVQGYGYVYGAGAEFAYSRSINLRLEALRYTLNGEKIGDAFKSSNGGFTHDVVRAGASYHFN